MVKEFIEQSITLVKEAMKDAKVSTSDIDEIILVGGQTRMPAIQAAVKEFFGKELNRSINPDEVVAIGAAIQGGILKGDVKDVLLLDVTPLSLGIETLGGVNTQLIAKNTTVPTSKSQVFSTAADNQTSVEVHVLQGERSMATDSKSLGRFILEGVPPAPRGTPQVEVTFDIDANGILSVTAKDKASGKTQSIRIEGSTGISDEEIERMKKDAESHKEDDKKRQELVTTKNEADSLVYTAEKALREAGDKVPEADVKLIKEKIDALKSLKDSDNIEDIKTAVSNLNGVIGKIGESMQKEQATGDKKEETVDVKAEEGSKAEEGTKKDKDKKE